MSGVTAPAPGSGTPFGCVSIRGAAAYSSLGDRSIQSLIREGKLAAHHVGRRMLIALSSTALSVQHRAELSDETPVLPLTPRPVSEPVDCLAMHLG